jgi:hypothetical protein
MWTVGSLRCLRLIGRQPDGHARYIEVWVLDQDAEIEHQFFTSPDDAASFIADLRRIAENPPAP